MSGTERFLALLDDEQVDIEQLFGKRSLIQNHKVLVDHVGRYHTDSPEDYVMQEETFGSWKDFEVWKTELEEKTVARFSVSSTSTTRSGKITYFICNRAKSRPSYNTTMTKKVVPYCTAHMMVKEHGQNLFVRFCKAHCGHDAKPARLSLNKKSKEYVASLRRQGSQPRQVVEKSRRLLEENIEVDEELPKGTEVQVAKCESTAIWQPPEEGDNGRVAPVHDMDGPSTRDMMAAAEAKLSVLKSKLFALSKGSSREDKEDMENVMALIDNAISVASDAVQKRHVNAKRSPRLAGRSELAAVARLPNHTPNRLPNRSASNAKRPAESNPKEKMCDFGAFDEYRTPPDPCAPMATDISNISLMRSCLRLFSSWKFLPNRDRIFFKDRREAFREYCRLTGANFLVHVAFAAFIAEFAFPTPDIMYDIRRAISPDFDLQNRNGSNTTVRLGGLRRLALEERFSAVQAIVCRVLVLNPLVIWYGSKLGFDALERFLLQYWCSIHL
ncbi:hypothetical protein Q1695_015470 [Nippostrongylus brasiliensis]|nr:hypothetical protein Q1695_015470 [Nippostrongylus brasiliensis]